MRYRYIAYKYMGKVGVDNILQGMWESFSAWPGPAAAIWRPPTDVYETEGNLVVIMELAGVAEEDLSITLFSDHLVVEGFRDQPELSPRDVCHQLGIKYGEFRSEIAVPVPIDHDNVIAEYRNGMLKINLPKQRR